MKFTTQDVENDPWPGGNSAQDYHGAWWFDICSDSHLNGEYLRGRHNQLWKGILWGHFKGWFYSYKVAEMKVAPHKNYNAHLFIQHFDKFVTFTLYKTVNVTSKGVGTGGLSPPPPQKQNFGQANPPPPQKKNPFGVILIM